MLKIVYFHGFPDFGHGFFSYLMCSGGPGYEDIPHLVRPGLVMLPDLAHRLEQPVDYRRQVLFAGYAADLALPAVRLYSRKLPGIKNAVVFINRANLRVPRIGFANTGRVGNPFLTFSCTTSGGSDK